METFKATQKFIRISPKKVRPIVGMIKKMTPREAVTILPFVGKAGSLPLLKVIKTALANAKQKGVDAQDLIFKEIQVGEGPRLKRGIPVSRGQWHPILKRMSHISVVLVTKDETQKPEKKASKKTAKVETQKKVSPKKEKKEIIAKKSKSRKETKK